MPSPRMHPASRDVFPNMMLVFLLVEVFCLAILRPLDDYAHVALAGAVLAGGGFLVALSFQCAAWLLREHALWKDERHAYRQRVEEGS